MTHTPGPWMLGADGATILAPETALGLHVAYLCDAHGNQLTQRAGANGHLIAAAPELLAALKLLLEETEYFSPPHDPATLAAKAAIAKAEGSAP